MGGLLILVGKTTGIREKIPELGAQIMVKFRV